MCLNKGNSNDRKIAVFNIFSIHLGIAGGMVTIVSGIYISEVSPVKYRSTLGSARSAEHH